MATLITLRPTRTYATRDNADKAVRKHNIPDVCRYLLLQGDDGRWFPVFVGETALQHGLHFHFNIVG